MSIEERHEDAGLPTAPPGGQETASLDAVPGPPEGIVTVLRSIFGALSAHAVGAAVRLQIFEAIGDGEATVEEIASRVSAHPHSTRRLLRALVGLELAVETAPDTYRLLPGGYFLNSQHQGSLSSLAKTFTDGAMVRAFEDLTESVRTGEPSFEKFFGKGYFDYLSEHPEKSEDFNAGMHESSLATANLVADHFNFGEFRTVVDVGGGDGTLLSHVLRRHSGIRGILFDSASGVAQAEGVLGQAGLSDRSDVVAGDFFAAVPQGDLFIVKGVLHNWSDSKCVSILQNIRKSISKEGKILIIEGVLPQKVQTEMVGSYLNDLNMLVNYGGMERTTDDFADLLQQSGFEAPTIDPLPAPGVSLVHARPA